MLAAPPPPIAAYGYSAPSEDDARRAIERQLGRAAMEIVWADACAATSARRSGAPLSGAELAPIAEYLASRDGVLRVLGRSLELRVRTYLLLSAASRPEAAR